MSKSFLVILTSFFTVFTLYVKIKYVDTELRQFIFRYWHMVNSVW